MSRRGTTVELYRAMVGIGLLCGLSIVGVFQLTRPVIAQNKAEALERAVFEVLPGATATRTFLRGDDGFTPAAGGDEAVGVPQLYAGFDDDGALVGVALEAAGMGYADTVKVLYGYDLTRQAVIGFQVLETKETPGLGDKIEKDPVFLKNFEALDVSLSDDGSAVANPIEFVKPGQKQHPWQIDGITGATISSNAVAKMLGESTADWVPRVARHRDDLQPAAEAEAEANAETEQEVDRGE